jgi:hypothetical protein
MKVESNSLLSEFQSSWFRNFFNSPYWGVKLALGMQIATLAVLTIAWCDGALGFDRQILPVMHLADGQKQPLIPVNLIGGYLAQANHGFYFLIIAPAFIVASAYFLRVADEALIKLIAQNRLPASGRTWVAETNRKLFRYVFWILLVVVGYKESKIEFPSIGQAMRGDTQLHGYVQEPALGKWAEEFAKATNKWVILSDENGIETVPMEVRHCLQAASLGTINLGKRTAELSSAAPRKHRRNWNLG